MGRPPGPSRVLPLSLADQLRELDRMGQRDRTVALLRAIADAGWGYQASAIALGVTRQTVSVWVKDADPELVAGFEVPPWRPKAAPVKVRPQLTEAERRELIQLQGQARMLRPEHGPGHPARLASERLSEVLDAHTRRGISFPQLAEAIGLRPKSVRARLMRHGRRKLESGMKAYRGADTDGTALLTKAWAAGKP